MKRALVLAAVAGGSLFGGIVARAADDIRPPETTAEHDARMAWFRQAKFGMFIHWGLYAVPAGSWNGKKVPGNNGEWIMHNARIPVGDYAKFTGEFNPTRFDAETWVKTARDAGMKYMVITTKHHDGFAMFHSAVDPYNIYDATPFKRDPIKELSDAAGKDGMKLGFYYSQAQDWHAPGGAVNDGKWDKAQDGSFDEYLKTKSVPQVREILSNYGTVAELWFDTPTQMTPERVATFADVLKIQPQLVVNNRLGHGFKGDIETPEQHIPPRGYPGRDWETCMTINDTWGYKSYDDHFKSTETLLHNLIDIASKGGNYLLNVGPDATGTIPPEEVKRLEEMGAWLKNNGEAIYGTGPTAFGDEDGAFSETEKDKNGKPVFQAKWEWRCTTKPGKLFIHVFKWPAEGLTLNGVKGKVSGARLLADPGHGALAVTQEGGKVSVKLPAEAPDPIATVVELDVTR